MKRKERDWKRNVDGETNGGGKGEEEDRRVIWEVQMYVGSVTQYLILLLILEPCCEACETVLGQVEFPFVNRDAGDSMAVQ